MFFWLNRWMKQLFKREIELRLKHGPSVCVFEAKYFKPLWTFQIPDVFYSKFYFFLKFQCYECRSLMFLTISLSGKEGPSFEGPFCSATEYFLCISPLCFELLSFIAVVLKQFFNFINVGCPPFLGVPDC